MMLISKGLSHRPECAWIGRCKKGCGKNHIYLSCANGLRWIELCVGPCDKDQGMRWQWAHNQPKILNRHLLTQLYLNKVARGHVDDAGLFLHTREPILRTVRWGVRFTIKDGIVAKVLSVKKKPGFWGPPPKLPENIGGFFVTVGKTVFTKPGLKLIDHGESAGPIAVFHSPKFEWEFYDIEKSRVQAQLSWKEPLADEEIRLITKNAAYLAGKNKKVLLDAILS